MRGPDPLGHVNGCGQVIGSGQIEHDKTHVRNRGNGAGYLIQQTPHLRSETSPHAAQFPERAQGRQRLGTKPREDSVRHTVGRTAEE